MDVPRSLREGSFALGANKWRMIATVVLPAASRGIMTGVLLALARVAGETAPLLFTAFGNRFWSPGWNAADVVASGCDLYLRHGSVRRLAPAGVGGGTCSARIGAGDEHFGSRVFDARDRV